MGGPACGPHETPGSAVDVDVLQPTERLERRGGGPGRALRRACFYGVAWWVLVGGSVKGWLFGAVAIPAAVAASLLLGPTMSMKLRPTALLGFLVRFLLESFLSAADVARRALHPRLPLAPGFVDYPLRLEGETPRVLLAATVTMLPGTISTEILEDRLVVHAIDATRPVASRVRRMETLVGKLFPGSGERGPAGDAGPP